MVLTNYNNNAFTGQVDAEARLVYNYAKSIKPPNGKVFKYVVFDGGCKVTLVDTDYGDSDVRELLDLEYPRNLDGVDHDSGYEDFMNSVQLVLFGVVAKPYVTGEVAERFFSNPKNFGYQAKRSGATQRGEYRNKAMMKS